MTPDVARLRSDYRDLFEVAAKSLGIHPPQFELPQDKWIDRNGVQLHALDWGGDALRSVVMLHGGGLTAHTWDFAALLLRDRYHVLALDQRGHGDSDWTPSPAIYERDKYEYMLEDLEAYIDSLRYSQVT